MDKEIEEMLRFIRISTIENIHQFSRRPSRNCLCTNILVLNKSYHRRFAFPLFLGFVICSGSHSLVGSSFARGEA